MICYFFFLFRRTLCHTMFSAAHIINYKFIFEVAMLGLHFCWQIRQLIFLFIIFFRSSSQIKKSAKQLFVDFMPNINTEVHNLRIIIFVKRNQSHCPEKEGLINRRRQIIFVLSSCLSSIPSIMYHRPFFTSTIGHFHLYILPKSSALKSIGLAKFTLFIQIIKRKTFYICLHQFSTLFDKNNFRHF